MLLNIKNHTSYRDATFDFPDGKVTVVYAPNDSGKTNLVYALTEALFGSPLYKHGAEMPAKYRGFHGSDSYFIDLKLPSLQIHQERKQGVLHTSAVIKGEDVAGERLEVRRGIWKHFGHHLENSQVKRGIPKSLTTDILRSFWINSDARSILVLKDTELSKYLSELFHLDDINEAIAKMRDDLRTANQRIADIHVDETIVSVSVDSLQAELDSLKARLDGCEHYTNISRIEQEYSELEERLSHLPQTRDIAVLEGLVKTIPTADVIQAALHMKKNYEDEAQRLKSTWEPQMKQLTGRLASLDNGGYAELDNIIEHEGQAQEALNKLVAERSRLTQSIRQPVICPWCENQVIIGGNNTLEKLDHASQGRLKEDLKEVTRRIDIVQGRIRQLKGYHEYFETKDNLVKQQQSLEERLKSIADELGKLSGKTDNAKTQLALWEEYGYAEQKKELQSRLEQLSERLKKLKISEPDWHRKEDLEKQIASAVSHNKLADIESEKRTRRDKLQSFIDRAKYAITHASQDLRRYGVGYRCSVLVDEINRILGLVQCPGSVEIESKDGKIVPWIHHNGMRMPIYQANTGSQEAYYNLAAILAAKTAFPPPFKNLEITIFDDMFAHVDHDRKAVIAQMIATTVSGTTIVIEKDEEILGLLNPAKVYRLQKRGLYTEVIEE